MVELLTAEQMREIERAAIESGSVTGLDLMERAGRGAVEAILEEWPELREGSHRAVVLCGPGNNGGDGFVVARVLKERGWEVEVFLYGDAGKIAGDARVNYERWCEEGDVSELIAAPRFDAKVDLYVDGLFGTGLSRPLNGVPSDWAVETASDPRFRDRVVALDIPSGLSGDTGSEIDRNGETVLVALTVTFHAPKLGHFLFWGPYKCGRLIVVDIGLSDQMRYERTRLVEAPDRLGKADMCHKFDHGHALILSGGVGRGGAARMAARGALRIGAGLVTVGCPPAALIENAAQLNAIMLHAVKDADALAVMLEDARLNALCLGPGLGTGAREAGLVRAALEARRQAVLDGDALTLLAKNADLMSLLHTDCVLTPHAGEFARLFPDTSDRLSDDASYSKVDAARDAAARAGCVIVFKGPDTVIASPDGRASINAAAYERAAPWLATAGSGDVLAGFVTGLLARGLGPKAAAEAAAWLHLECALAFGPGLIAEDLPEMLPRVLSDLEAE